MIRRKNLKLTNHYQQSGYTNEFENKSGRNRISAVPEIDRQIVFTHVEKPDWFLDYLNHPSETWTSFEAESLDFIAFEANAGDLI